MAKLFSGGYEINEREFSRGWEDTSDLLTIFGMVMLLNGAAGAAKGNASGGNLQYTMAGGGTVDAAMAITAENAMVIAALNSMYPDTSNDGIIRRIEGEAGPEKTVTNSAGQEVTRKYVKDQDELLKKAEEAAGGNLDDFTEIKPGWYQNEEGTIKIEWNPEGHTNTNEGPHVTVRHKFETKRQWLEKK